MSIGLSGLRTTPTQKIWKWKNELSHMWKQNAFRHMHKQIMQILLAEVKLPQNPYIVQHSNSLIVKISF